MSLTIYKSSAGSGKTYTLSKEYLRLALRAPDYYQKILAVTFTNRAAEEMKERVLEFMIDIANGYHELVAVFAQDLNVSESEIQERAKASLSHLLHHYSFFNITTIDTFFHRVIRAFSREIGLQGNFGIELDDQKVTEIIANDLYEGVEDDEKLKKWLVDFSMNRLGDGKGYEFKNEIKDLADQLFDDEYKKLSKSQLDDPALKEKIKQLQDQLFQKKYSFENQLKKLGQGFFEMLAQNGLEPSDLIGGQRSAIASFFTKLQKKNYSALINATVEKCLDNPESWSTKTSSKRDLIMSVAENHLIAHLNEAVDFFQSNEKDYYTANAVLRHLFTLGLLSDLSLRLQEYKKEEEVIMISDLPDFLSQIINDSDTPFIYEKVGSRYHHFFIDEFQDTSWFQWNNFKPLILESLASGNENIIVGDAKQSIYRWRGGDPSLLMNQVEKEVAGVSVNDSNQVNYRSAGVIINFNNKVFSKLPGLIGESVGEGFSVEEVDKLLLAYNKVEQEVASFNKEMNGLVQFEFLQRERDERFNEVALDKMVRQIEELQLKGHSLNDMAILVRTNWEAEQIVNYVLKYKQEHQTTLEVISAEGMLLKNSHVVKLLLTTFNYLIHPEDSVVEKDLVFQYQQVVLGRKMNRHEEFANLDQSQLPESFRKHQQHLLHLPIFELTEVLIRLFKLNELDADFAYLQAFQDAILEFGKNNRSDVRQFLEWWADEENNRSVQLTGALNAIEIITSHKSKGLQYPIVFIPFCTFQLDSRSHTSWYHSPEEDPFGLVSNVPVEYASNLSKTHFADKYQQEKSDWYLESLNILYVAFTRAERGLFVYAEQPSEKTRNWAGDVGKVMWKFFEENPLDGWDASTMIYKDGTLDVAEKKPLANVISLTNYSTNKWSNRITIRKTGKSYFDDTSISKRNEGILLHQLLSEIIHFDDTSKVLDQYEFNMEITKEDRSRYESLINNLWSDDQIKAWFDGTGEVKTEVVVLPKDGETKRIDRVVIDGNKATVIDFKSGAKKPEDNVQLVEYVQLMEEMGYQPEGYLLYLKSGEVVDMK